MPQKGKMCTFDSHLSTGLVNMQYPSRKYKTMDVTWIFYMAQKGKEVPISLINP